MQVTATFEEAQAPPGGHQQQPPPPPFPTQSAQGAVEVEAQEVQLGPKVRCLRRCFSPSFFGG